MGKWFVLQVRLHKHNKESKLHIIWMWCTYKIIYCLIILACFMRKCYSVLYASMCAGNLSISAQTSVINYIVYMSSASSSSSSRIDTCIVWWSQHIAHIILPQFAICKRFQTNSFRHYLCLFDSRSYYNRCAIMDISVKPCRWF